MAERVSTSELQAALEAVLASYFGASQPIVHLQRAASAYSSSFALEELRVEFANGASLDLMFKDLSPGGLSAKARAAKPAFLYDPGREIAIYRHVLASTELGTAKYFGAVTEPSLKRYWLFIEQVRGRELYQIGEVDAWQKAARWLATLHSHFASQVEAVRNAIDLTTYDADYYRHWAARAVEFAGRRASPDDRRRLERIAANYDRVVQKLAALPVTLIHGEFYASNVLVRDAPEGQVCPIDWEMAAIGSGLIDLAALTSGRWTDAERTNLALTYLAAYPFGDEKPPSPTDFLATLDVCRLHTAMQWLGWAPDWTPPRDHAHDWLREALTLAAMLGLD